MKSWSYFTRRMEQYTTQMQKLNMCETCSDFYSNNHFAWIFRLTYFSSRKAIESKLHITNSQAFEERSFPNQSELFGWFRHQNSKFPERAESVTAAILPDCVTSDELILPAL